MLTYLIDGNNLIGKIPSLMSLQKKDKQASRERILHLLDRYFHSKKTKVILFFDGFENGKLNASHLKINYSDKITADEKIKSFITDAKSTRNIIVITSDSNLSQFAKKCSCKVISSDNFAAEIAANKQKSEFNKPDATAGLEEFKKLFGVDE